MKQCSGIDVHFTGWEPVRIADLVAAERNNRRHGDEQVALLAKNIRALGWRWPVIVSELSGRIVAGHCRVDAARLIGADCVPVVLQAFQDAAHEEAFRLADNRIAELAEIQTETIKGLLAELDTGEFDMDLTGYVESVRDDMATDADDADDVREESHPPELKAFVKFPPRVWLIQSVEVRVAVEAAIEPFGGTVTWPE